MSGNKNGATNAAPSAPQETEEVKALRLEKEQFASDKAAFEADKKASADAIDAEREKLDSDQDAFKAEQDEVEREAEEAAIAESTKQEQIKDYQDKVKTNNKEDQHIDFHKTGIDYFGSESRKVGKPTAKAPTKRKDANGEIIDVPNK